jgi:hypothetical protein
MENNTQDPIEKRALQEYSTYIQTMEEILKKEKVDISKLRFSTYIKKYWKQSIL